MITYTRWALLPKLLSPEEDRGAVDAFRPEPETDMEQTQAVSTDSSRHEIEQVARDLASAPVALARLIDGLDDDALTQPAEDGGWGVVEIISHLRDWERIYADRLLQSTLEDPATLEEYDDSLWAIERGYRDLDTREVLAEFTKLRNALVERMLALEPDWLQRTVVLPKQGPRTLLELLQSLAVHDAKHLLQVKDVLA